MNEVWKPVVGLEGCYEVSNLGRVRSVSRTVEVYGGRRRVVPSCIRKQGKSKAGYPQLHLSGDGVNTVEPVHKLVAEAFLGPRESGQTVNHIDGNKANNSVGNLEYCDHRENNRHALRTGLRINPRGSRHGLARLTESIVLEIRSALSSGEQQKSLAKRYGVSKSLINQIAKGRIWQHA